MPKVKLCADYDDGTRLRNNIEALRSYYWLTDEQLANAAGITARTYRERIKRPQLFTHEELAGIARKCKTTVSKLESENPFPDDSKQEIKELKQLLIQLLGKVTT